MRPPRILRAFAFGNHPRQGDTAAGGRRGATAIIPAVPPRHGRTSLRNLLRRDTRRRRAMRFARGSARSS